MPRNYTKVEHLSAEILRRKYAGETNRQIAESYHLTVEQVKNLVTRQNRKMRLVNGDIRCAERADQLEKTLMN